MIAEGNPDGADSDRLLRRYLATPRGAAALAYQLREFLNPGIHAAEKAVADARAAGIVEDYERGELVNPANGRRACPHTFRQNPAHVLAFLKAER